MTAAERLSLTVLVFALGADSLILVHLEDEDADRAAADAASRGYHYAGYLAVNRGTPTVQIEEGFESAVFHAAQCFASMVGVALKRAQLETVSA